MNNPKDVAGCTSCLVIVGLTAIQVAFYVLLIAALGLGVYWLAGVIL